MSWLDRLFSWFGGRPFADPTPPAPIAPFDEREVIRLHNDARRRADLLPLLRDPYLSSLATSRAAHAASLGLTPAHLHDGFKVVPGSTTSGENAAIGQPDARSVMVTWMESDGHRHNILNPDFATMGAGRAISRDGRPYWYVVFAGIGRHA